MRDNWAFEVVPEHQSCTVVQTVSREMRSSAWDDSHRKSFRDTEKGLIVVLEVETLGKSRPRNFFPRDGGRLSGSSSAFRPVKSQPAQAFSRSSPCWWLASAARGGVAYVSLENKARGPMKINPQVVSFRNKPPQVKSRVTPPSLLEKLRCIARGEIWILRRPLVCSQSNVWLVGSVM